MVGGVHAFSLRDISCTLVHIAKNSLVLTYSAIPYDMVDLMITSRKRSGNCQKQNTLTSKQANRVVILFNDEKVT